MRKPHQVLTFSHNGDDVAWTAEVNGKEEVIHAETLKWPDKQLRPRANLAAVMRAALEDHKDLHR